jgi:hypothetical protein
MNYLPDGAAQVYGMPCGSLLLPNWRGNRGWLK